MECAWCNENGVKETVKDCYWVMPDGRRSVKILQVPAVECPHCGVYVSDAINQKVEDSLYIGDLANFPDTFTYEELLNAPKIKLFDLK